MGLPLIAVFSWRANARENIAMAPRLSGKEETVNPIKQWRDEDDYIDGSTGLL